MTPEWLPRAQELRERRWIYRRIADDLGVSISQVKYWLNRDKALAHVKRSMQESKVQHTCPDCGATFWRHPRFMGEGKCYDCSSNRKRTGEQRACRHCGGEFYARRSLPKKFCSRVCWFAWKDARIPFSGPVPHDVRKVFNVRLKGERACRRCGSTHRIELHHVIPRSMSREARTELRNGLPLCVTCHRGWHERRVVIYRDVFTPEEWAYISSVDLLGQDTAAWLEDRYPVRPEQLAA